MKEFLMISGGIFLILIALIAVTVLAIVIAVFIFLPRYLKSLPQTLEINEEAQDYVNTAILETVSDWNFHKLYDKATPQLLELSHSEESEKIIDFCRQLGKLEAYKGAVGGWQSSTEGSKEIYPKGDRKFGKITLGNYVAEADFEKAPATIKVQIIRRENQWLINSFTISTQGVITTLGMPTTLEALVETDEKKSLLEALIKVDEQKD
ncbi:hypothetical protein ACE1B6_26610 [Aerosakkonemataceae cyanobacterium BLCC-F154]|uniref:Uncharacterized protein n=1 Tax=Floridaenema fluviatile BLCC-F154 TaxID=3153640 RepID=A0ABV4YJ17_9CYAN